MEQDDKLKLTEIDFHYIKTHNYRSYHVDGIFGGLTSRGNIYIELFLERKPTPTRVKHAIKKTGEIGDEIERDSKNGFIREIECGLMMDINTAKSLHSWLDKRIKELEQLIKNETINKTDEITNE